MEYQKGDEGVMRKKYIIVSGADERYICFLDGLLESIGQSHLEKYDLGIIDLGLSETGRERIRSHNVNVIFEEPDWPYDFHGKQHTPKYKMIFLLKPFLPNIFPGYDGYIWIDADVWFQYPDAIDDYVTAGQSKGAAFSFEAHPCYRSTQKIRKHGFFARRFLNNIKDYFFEKSKNMFGVDVAVRNGLHPILNSGLFYIGDRWTPIWSAWQNSIMEADLMGEQRSTQICDQTCLLVSIIQHNIPYCIMPSTHNWLPHHCVPIIDEKHFILLDPAYPNPPIKAIHLVGVKFRKLSLSSTRHGRIITAMDWKSFQEVKMNYSPSDLLVRGNDSILSHM